MGGSSSESASTINNADKRNAVQGGVGASGDGNVITNVSNDTEVVKAIAMMGGDVLKSAGGAIVDLHENNAKAQVEAWSKTLMTGEALVSKMLDSVQGGFSIAEKSIESFQPNENKSTGAAMWLGVGAIGLVALAALSRK